jgi:hypothetical protein
VQLPLHAFETASGNPLSIKELALHALLVERNWIKGRFIQFRSTKAVFVERNYNAVPKFEHFAAQWLPIEPGSGVTLENK